MNDEIWDYITDCPICKERGKIVELESHKVLEFRDGKKCPECKTDFFGNPSSRGHATMNIIQWIKALWVLKSLTNNIKENKMKNGISSTEFWLNLVTIAGTVYGSLSGFIPQAIMLKVVGVLVIAYTISRSLVKVAEIVVKLTTSTKDDIIVNGINAVLNKIEETFKPKA